MVGSISSSSLPSMSVLTKCLTAIVMLSFAFQADSVKGPGSGGSLRLNFSPKDEHCRSSARVSPPAFVRPLTLITSDFQPVSFSFKLPTFVLDVLNRLDKRLGRTNLTEALDHYANHTVCNVTEVKPLAPKSVALIPEPSLEDWWLFN